MVDNTNSNIKKNIDNITPFSLKSGTPNFCQ